MSLSHVLLSQNGYGFPNIYMIIYTPSIGFKVLALDPDTASKMLGLSNNTNNAHLKNPESASEIPQTASEKRNTYLGT